MAVDAGSDLGGEQQQEDHQQEDEGNQPEDQQEQDQQHEEDNEPEDQQQQQEDNEPEDQQEQEEDNEPEDQQEQDQREDGQQEQEEDNEPEDQQEQDQREDGQQEQPDEEEDDEHRTPAAERAHQAALKKRKKREEAGETQREARRRRDAEQVLPRNLHWMEVPDPLPQPFAREPQPFTLEERAMIALMNDVKEFHYSNGSMTIGEMLNHRCAVRLLVAVNMPLSMLVVTSIVRCSLLDGEHAGLESVVCTPGILAIPAPPRANKTHSIAATIALCRIKKVSRHQIVRSVLSASLI